MLPTLYRRVGHEPTHPLHDAPQLGHGPLERVDLDARLPGSYDQVGAKIQSAGPGPLPGSLRIGGDLLLGYGGLTDLFPWNWAVRLDGDLRHLPSRPGLIVSHSVAGRQYGCLDQPDCHDLHAHGTSLGST